MEQGFESCQSNPKSVTFPYNFLTGWQSAAGVVIEGCPRSHAGPGVDVVRSPCTGQDWSQIQKGFLGEWPLSRDDSLNQFSK